MVCCHEIADKYSELREVNGNLQNKMEGLLSENADLRSKQNSAAVERAEMKKEIELLKQLVMGRTSLKQSEHDGQVPVVNM